MRDAKRQHAHSEEDQTYANSTIRANAGGFDGCNLRRPFINIATIQQKNSVDQNQVTGDCEQQRAFQNKANTPGSDERECNKTPLPIFDDR